MADPTKHGFWQTVPGMMTAGAGILSATTGMLVALNQTGVVDLRQLAGGKPAAQSSPVETSSTALRTEVKPSGARPDTEKSVVKDKKQEDHPLSAPRAPDHPARPAPDAVEREVEAKTQGSTAPYPTPAVGAKSPAPETERRVTESTTHQEPPPSVLPAQDKSMRTKPIPEPVVEAKKQQKSPSISVTRPDAAKEPGADTERRAEPMTRREERARSATGAQNDGTRPRPETPERVAEVRRREEAPTVKQPSDQEEKKPKVLRQSPEEPRAVGKAKAPTTEPPEKKPSEPASEAKKEKRQVAQAETKQPEKAPGSTTAPLTKQATATNAPPLKLTGLALTAPGGWMKEALTPSPMGPVAVFKIPKTDPNSEDGTVRITHFPDMKGKEKNEMNIDRWLGQVSKPDGQPSTRSDAKITTTESGSVRLTVVDLSGSVKMTMRDTAKPNQRMIAAIVDHPQGPHFVVTAGPAASMEKWAAQIDAFLKSAKVE